MRRPAVGALVRDVAIAAALALPLWLLFDWWFCGPPIAFGGGPPETATCQSGALSLFGWLAVTSPLVAVVAFRAAGRRGAAPWWIAGTVVLVALAATAYTL